MKFYIGQWSVESESSARTYTVSQTQEVGQLSGWECSCVGWTRHMPRRDCKHILWVKNGGGRKIDPLAMACIKAQRRAAA